MSKTPKKIYTASSNATGSLGNSAHCKTFFGKANRTFLAAAEENYGSSLQRCDLLPHLLSRPCKRRLETPQRLRLISKSKRSLERVKRCIEESRSVLRSLKTSKATGNSLARVSRSTRRGLDFEAKKNTLLTTFIV